MLRLFALRPALSLADMELAAVYCKGDNCLLAIDTEWLATERAETTVYSGDQH